MSIGKSSIQRAANNGYSNVKSTAPDMENSVIVEKTPAEAEPKKVLAVEVKEPAKAPVKAKKTPAKKPAPKKASTPQKVENKKAEKATRVGDEMPYFLL